MPTTASDVAVAVAIIAGLLAASGTTLYHRKVTKKEMEKDLMNLMNSFGVNGGDESEGPEGSEEG